MHGAISVMYLAKDLNEFKAIIVRLILLSSSRQSGKRKARR